MVVYDDEDVPTEFLSICLDCNAFRTYPGNILVNSEDIGFSAKTRNQLRQMFFKWGIDYYGFSEFWDDEQKYEAFLARKRETNLKPNDF